MQVDRTAGTARVVGSVRGLGVCDVLRVELAPVQRGGLEQGLAARSAELERRRAVEREQPEEIAEALRLLARIRDALPPQATSPVSLIGPAGLVLALVEECVAGTVARLAERLREAPEGYGALVAELEAAAAWIGTALDCEAVESFCFEPGVDPCGAW